MKRIRKVNIDKIELGDTKESDIIAKKKLLAIIERELSKPECDCNYDLVKECFQAIEELNVPIYFKIKSKKQLSHDMALKADNVEKKQIAHKKLSKLSIAVASIIILLILFFFATPMGQVLAADFYKAIVQFVSEGILISNKTSSEQDFKEIPEGDYEFSSLEDVNGIIGEQFIFIDSDNVTFQVATVSANDVIITINSSYKIKNAEDSLLVQQLIFEEDTQINSITFSEDEPVYEYKLFNGEIVYCSKTVDGIFGIASWDNIQLIISSETLDIDKLAIYINQLSIKK